MASIKAFASTTAAVVQGHYDMAKSIREHQSGLERGRLELELAERGSTMNTDAREKFEARRDKMKAEENRYHGEKEKLYEEAKDMNIPGRSRMTKAQLMRAVNRRAGRRGK